MTYLYHWSYPSFSGLCARNVIVVAHRCVFLFKNHYVLIMNDSNMCHDQLYKYRSLAELKIEEKTMHWMPFNCFYINEKLILCQFVGLGSCITKAKSQRSRTHFVFTFKWSWHSNSEVIIVCQIDCFDSVFRRKDLNV